MRKTLDVSLNGTEGDKNWGRILCVFVGQKVIKKAKCVFNDDCRAIISQPYQLQNHLQRIY